MLTHAGHKSIRLAKLPSGCGDMPVIIVNISDVAILVYSPVLKAATASADAVKAAINKNIQPNKRPKNIFNLLFQYALLSKRLKVIFKKNIKNV